MSATREDRIRAEAYNRWEKEGRPHGAHERHWHEASAAVDEPKESAGEAQAVPAEKPKKPRVKKIAAE